MHASNRAWMALLVAALLAATGCTHNSLDDGDGPDNVLAITNLTPQPVTAEEGTVGTGCTLEVQDWTGTASNIGLSEEAGPESSPFNAIVLEDVVISYDWAFPPQGPVPTTPTRTVGLGDIAILPGGSNGFRFAPISFQDLNADVQGLTANLTLVFRSRTIEGEHMQTTVTRQLFVEACGGP